MHLITNHSLLHACLYFFFPMAQQPGRRHYPGFMITVLDIPHTVGLLWTSDQSDADTST